MAYVDPNYKTKKALKDAVAAQVAVGVFQPNDMFGAGVKVQHGTPDDSYGGIHGKHVSFAGSGIMARWNSSKRWCPSTSSARTAQKGHRGTSVR